MSWGLHRTCNRCRALAEHYILPRCELGYRIEQKRWKGVIIGSYPEGCSCPKPITYEELDDSEKVEYIENLGYLPKKE